MLKEVRKEAPEKKLASKQLYLEDTGLKLKRKMTQRHVRKPSRAAAQNEEKQE